MSNNMDLVSQHYINIIVISNITRTNECKTKFPEVNVQLNATDTVHLE